MPRREAGAAYLPIDKPTIDIGKRGSAASPCRAQ
jgi:hypothetical protein